MAIASLLLFAIGIATPFFFLSIPWALGALIYVTMLSQILLIFPISILKPLTFKGRISVKQREMLIGFSEALFIILITQLKFVPENFLIAASLPYIFNQLARFFRGYGKDELHQLIGFIILIAPVLIGVWFLV